MEVLIDTNVFIERESDWRVPEPLQSLERLLRTQGHDILVHKLSKEEIRNYENQERRELAESKIATYADLRYPKYPTSSDEEFLDEIGWPAEFNEQVDTALLFSVYSEQVDILITEDKGIHKKAGSLGIPGKVLTISEAKDYFEDEPTEVPSPPSINKVRLGDLDVGDPIFDPLKEDYEFTDWFEDHPDRDAYVNRNPDGSLGAVLILKPGEVEKLGDTRQLRKKDRLKISTLIVAEERWGSKTGELLISISVREAMNHEIDEIYLTHHTLEDDYLVQLISSFGFTKEGENEHGEDIFIKRLTPGLGDDPTPRETHVRFYPSYHDGEHISKFLVPVKPVYHSRLFTSYQKRHPKLHEFSGQFHSEGNAIKKAYLSHAKTRQVESNDVLLFYRTKDHKSVTSIGVCERIDYGLSNADRIEELVGRRSVFSTHEIEEMAESPTTVILFKWHFDLPDPVHYRVLLDQEYLSSSIRTTQQIDHDTYEFIRDIGGIDERFTIN